LEEEFEQERQELQAALTEADATMNDLQKRVAELELDLSLGSASGSAH
jgi:hypothetical protein